MLIFVVDNDTGSASQSNTQIHKHMDSYTIQEASLWSAVVGFACLFSSALFNVEAGAYIGLSCILVGVALGAVTLIIETFFTR